MINYLNRKRRFSNLFLITLSLSILNCKKETKSFKVVEIFSGIIIEKNKFHYSEESILSLNDKNYWLRHKGIYDSNNSLNKVIFYGTEGNYEYSKDEIKNDTKLLKSLRYPLNQNWFIIDNLLKTNKTDKTVEKITNDIYAINSNNRIIFYKIKS